MPGMSTTGDDEYSARPGVHRPPLELVVGALLRDIVASYTYAATRTHTEREAHRRKRK